MEVRFFPPGNCEVNVVSDNSPLNIYVLKTLLRCIQMPYIFILTIPLDFSMHNLMSR